MIQKSIKKSNFTTQKSIIVLMGKLPSPVHQQIFKNTLRQYSTNPVLKKAVSFEHLKMTSPEPLPDEHKPVQYSHALDHAYDLTLITSDSSQTMVLKTDQIKENLGILAQVKASHNEEEIKTLFRKMVLNFRSTTDESSFFIKDGVFRGTFFKLKKHGNTLNLNIKNAQKNAISLLCANKMILKERLAHHQIELNAFKFSS